MLEIMVEGINGLITMLASGKAIYDPTKNLRDKKPVAVWKHGEISCLNLDFNFSRILRDHVRIHASANIIHDW
jgi:hypothetical protein